MISTNAHKGAFYFTLHFTTFLPFLQEQTVDFRTKNSGKGQKYENFTRKKNPERIKVPCML